MTTHILTFESPKDAQLVTSSTKTKADVVAMVAEKITKQLAWHYGVGDKTGTRKPATIVVKRAFGGETKTCIKLGIANHTAKLFPIADTSRKGIIEALKLVSENLDQIEDALYEAWQMSGKRLKPAHRQVVNSANG
jgi:hypothetical protein|tara:strand:- start:1608 stop:2015 length:408 start_codon:yes stop_codon:yes gene_type:complete